MALGAQKTKISPRGKCKIHKFKGLDTVADSLSRMLANPDPIIVYFDPDVDGAIAGYLVCKYLRKHGHPFQWYINSNRSHDWSLDTSKVYGRNVIAVDFIITAEKVKELCDYGVELISMDHHENGNEFISYISEEGKVGVVVNNQYPFEEEDGRYLSGAGVVFETLVGIDSGFDTLLNRQLVGITLLSDIRDIENELAEDYLYKLYSAKYDGFIHKLIESTIGERDYGFGVPKMDRNFVDFKFSPALNACFRFNRQEEVVKFLLGVGELNCEWRNRQKSLVAELISNCKVVEFEHLRVVYFEESDFLEYSDVLSNFVGLCASQFLKGDKSVICYMISEDSFSGGRYVKRASFRGNYNGLGYNKAISSENGMFECKGHGSAFGIKGMKPSRNLFTKVDEICGKVEEGTDKNANVIDICNLSMFLNGGKAFKIAEDNMYKLSQNQTMIRYTGGAIKVKREGSSYREYEVDGIPVMSFHLKSRFDQNLVSIVLDRGLCTFYLE
jgi:single-stranded-DNA-specific exonuclease